MRHEGNSVNNDLKLAKKTNHITIHFLLIRNFVLFLAGGIFCEKGNKKKKLTSVANKRRDGYEKMDDSK